MTTGLPEVDAADPSAQSPSRFKMALRIAFFIMGIALLGGSIYYAVRDPDQWHTLAQADPRTIVWLAVLTLISGLVLPGFLFWFAFLPFVDPKRPVSLGAMQAIIAASALLNYTPVKAGLVGRIAYMKHRHGVSYRASFLLHSFLTLSMLSAMTFMLFLLMWRGGFDLWWWLGMIVSYLIIAMSLGVAVQLVEKWFPQKFDVPQHWHGHPLRVGGELMLWMAFTAGTVAVMALRLQVAFGLFDRPVRYAEATFLALSDMFTRPLPGNGLGFREWLFAQGSAWGIYGGDPEQAFETVMTAALLDRAIEALIVVPLGLAALIWLRKHFKAMRMTPPV